MNKEKQTILLIRNAAPRDFGGAETYPVSLASVLTNQGLSPIIVTRSKKLLHYAHEHAIPTVRGWWWSHQNWSGKYALLLPIYLGWQIILTCWYVHLIKKTRATALHIQSKDDFIAATIAGRLTKRKTVWTDHMDLRYIEASPSCVKRSSRSFMWSRRFWRFNPFTFLYSLGVMPNVAFEISAVRIA